MVQARSRAWPLLTTLVLLVSCTATTALPPESADEPAASEAAGELPSSLASLELDDHQRAQAVEMLDELKRDVEPLRTATRDLALAFARSARRCKRDSPFIEMEASFAVTVGEQTRGSVLEAINRLHAILTPAQRKALVQRLLGEDDSRDEEKESRDDDRARDIGSDLDLSIGQMMIMLVRVRAVQSAIDERIEPWREHYRDALIAFEGSVFDVREQAIAKAPIVEIATDLARDAFRVLIPVLEPPQCEVLATMIKERFDDRPTR